ncbi:MAG: molecular chaperone HtpG [Bacteroidota bacterium]
MKKGNIAVQTENIFPIIKQFLYSDQEIFLRELISNAVDATNKLKTLSAKGEPTGELGDLTIEIIADKENKTLTIRDRGIGMTEEEVEKYLNQVAFSSAQEFLDKYKDEANIIGHFGLGFYSAFMVADKVEAVTRSYKEGSTGVTWSCEGDPSYELADNDKATRGTDIVLHISEDSTDYLEEARIQELLDKYCKFLPIPIQFGMRKESITEGEGEEAETKEIEVPNVINEHDPIWKKSPSELTDEDYKAFYQVLYPYSAPPMFWIHLNIDYPFNLTGILYFPKLNNSFEVQKNKIQLYSNQVYVTDEVKEIVPEFLTLLHGVIDSPDIPLNVSRSYLQADQNVKKINTYITKKVADRLNELFKKERESFEEKWNDLSVFVKYGMISDDKFYDKATKFVLLKNVDEELYTIADYRAKVEATQKDKHDRTIGIYANDPASQDGVISAAKKHGYDVLLLDHIIDNHFIQVVEQKEDKFTFVRVDSDTVDNLVQTDEKKEMVLSEEQSETVKTIFGKVAGEGKTVDVKALSPDDQPVQIVRPEFMRRMMEMQAMQGGNLAGIPDMYNVVVNGNHPLVAEKLLSSKDEAENQAVADYLYKLALLNQNMLKGSELTAFVEKSLGFLK